jgi:hypothetical protein
MHLFALFLPLSTTLSLGFAFPSPLIRVVGLSSTNLFGQCGEPLQW